MPNSNDNQDYGESDEKNKQEKTISDKNEKLLTSDDLKGKKVDADPDNEKGTPAEQKK
ncbi:MAG TPA: hypothetical protein VLJ41_13015 [Segetibacter sp.]|nr:hypothetical protein [Segetibacter sp.]